MTRSRWAGIGRRLGVSAILVLVAGAVAAPVRVAGDRPSRAVTSPSNADDWPMLQHDATHSGLSTDPAVGATAAAEGLALKWKVPAGSGMQSTPAVVYNATLNKTLVYVETMNNTLLALDAASGATIWSYTQASPINAYSSPTVNQNTVYVGGSADHTMWAIDATTGALQCSFATTGRIFDGPVVTDLGVDQRSSSATPG